MINYLRPEGLDDYAGLYPEKDQSKIQSTNEIGIAEYQEARRDKNQKKNPNPNSYASNYARQPPE
jgi:hypothetical protein